MSYEVELKRFLRKRRLKGFSEKTLSDDEQQIKRFLEYVENREITPDIVLDYLDYITMYTYTRKGVVYKYSKYSLYQIETKLRLFLNTLDPTLCTDIHPKMPKNYKLPEDMPTEEDIEKLLNACHTLRDKALISFLFESGVRKGELFSIKKNNVSFDSMGAVVTIPAGKTGSRRIRVVFSASYLKMFLENHPSPDASSLLFCSIRAPYGGLSDSGLKGQLKELAKRAGIQKNIYPHLLRHASVTRLAKYLPEQSLKTYFGWSQGSSMAAVYVHLSGSDIDPAILAANGISEPQKSIPDVLQTTLCSRCHERQPVNEFCFKCGYPLSHQGFSEEATMESLVAKLLEKPEFVETFLKYMSKKNGD